MQAGELGILAEPPVVAGSAAADQQLAVDAEPPAAFLAVGHPQLLVGHQRRSLRLTRAPGRKKRPGLQAEHLTPSVRVREHLAPVETR